MATPTPAKYFNVFLDSDGPIADFNKALKTSGMHTDDFKHLAGVYLWLDVTPGAREALEDLKRWDDLGLIRVYIATKTPSNSPYAYTEKVLWYRREFPWLEDRVILTHDKSVLGGRDDILVDDRPHKGNASKFKGTFILFDVDKPEECWESVVTTVERQIVCFGRADKDSEYFTGFA